MRPNLAASTMTVLLTLAVWLYFYYQSDGQVPLNAGETFVVLALCFLAVSGTRWLRGRLKGKGSRP